MTEQPPGQNPAETPVDPLYTHPASPFLRTEAPMPVAFASPPAAQPQAEPASVPQAHAIPRTQIEFGLAMLAYLMVLVGAVTVVQANSTADWRYYIAALPVIPAALVIWVFVRALGRLDELQRRIQTQAFGFAIATTSLLTFGYGFLEGRGVPHLNWAYLLPFMTILWGIGTLVFRWRNR